MKSALEESLARREAEALDRVRSAARDLKAAVVTAGRRVVAIHPWALPSVGFSAGLLAPFLVRERATGHESCVIVPPPPDEETPGIGDQVRVIVAGALADAFAVIVEGFLVRDGGPGVAPRNGRTFSR